MKKSLDLNISQGLDSIKETLRIHPHARYLHVDHSSLNSRDSNIILLARNNASVKEKLVCLANLGFLTYNRREQTSSLVHISELRELWIPVKSGVFSISDEGLVYTYTPPLDGRKAKRLLIVFSSIATTPSSSSLMRHFEQNFKSIQKYLPQDAAVLRIADLGGVVGGYYMNTNHLKENEANIQKLVKTVCCEHEIEQENVVLYGVSKGASGALLHSLMGRYKAVCVDPVVTDSYYEQFKDDAHFTIGTFPESKENKFARLARSIDGETVGQTVSIVTSENSPQYPIMAETLGSEFMRAASVFVSTNESIKDHPEVGPHTIHVTVMLINMAFYNLNTRRTVKSV